MTRAVEGSTYLYIPSGTTVSVKCGSTGHLDKKELLANVQAVVEQAVDKLPGKWGGIDEITLRVGESVGVPVYARTTAGLLEIEGMGREEGKSKKRKVSEDGDEKKDAPKKVGRKEKKSPLLKALEEKKVEGGREKSRKEKRKALQPDVKPPVKKAKAKDDVEIVKREKEEEVKKVTKSKVKKAAAAAADETAGDVDFLAAKKFKRSLSAPGFVFKKGPKGMGFYKDKKPKVDREFLDMLKNMGGGRRGGGGSGKKKGRKGRR